jgi:hypothetical protein
LLSFFKKFFQFVRWQVRGERADVGQEVFALRPGGSGVAGLPGVSSTPSVTALSLLGAVSRNVTYLATSEASAFPHSLFALFD